MPYSIYIDPEVNCVFVELTGVLNFGDLDASTSAVFEHPLYRAGMNVLRDIRKQTISEDWSYHSMSKEAQTQMERHDTILGKCKWAVLVPDANFYAKVHQFITTGRLGNHLVERKPFRELDAALEWLGVPTDYEIKYPEG